MKKVLISILVLLTGFLLMTNVKAEDDKTLVIELPSNEVNVLDFSNSFNVKEWLSLIFILYDSIITSNGNELSDVILVNDDGKEVIKYTMNEENMTYSFSLLDNVTKEDCVFDLKQRIERSSNKKVIKKILGGYDKVQIDVKKIEYEHFKMNDSFVLDFSCYDCSMINWVFLLEVFNQFNNIEEIFSLVNNQNKTLATITKQVKHEGSNSGIVYVEVFDGVTSEDDVIIPVSNELSNFAEYYDISLTGYSNLVIKFSDYEYDDENYIIDIKLLNKDNIEDIKYFLYDMPYHGFADFINVVDWSRVVKSEDGRTLLSLYEAIYAGVPVFILGENVSYKDNKVFETSDDLKNSLKMFFGNNDIDSLRNIIMKFADPVFLEGKEQTYNLKDKDKMSFRLNIPYDKFLEYGKVYIDDKLVDSKNYEVSKGSTIITLNKDYVTKLNKGEHNIRVEMIDGEVTTTFNIVDRVEIIEPIVEAVNKIIVENPETGDKIIICSILLVLSLIGVLVFRKKGI